MPELERLAIRHAPALLHFEQVNRAYFARFVPDRGDDYFAEFTDRLVGLLTEQETGQCHFHVLVDDDGTVLGRFNLVDVADGSAVLGYRVAERATGRGLAREGVHRVCALARRSTGCTGWSPRPRWRIRPRWRCSGGRASCRSRRSCSAASPPSGTSSTSPDHVGQAARAGVP
ncbi:GNAT family N-acetyltransferase [Micromonospora sp. AMSO31t]|uniref:GNAT family N-acetyltransferase n=1 Tax=Micromonospora sp. AMSO31t TaxID=2650566 RepID=UPI001CECA9B3|nr:GNAT family N-acetyltransferase [Micromonospora sp. AMSO31t]